MTDNRKSWTVNQDQAILQIVALVGTKNWPQVSQLMKEKYHLNHRSGKQCRQRWHNHLNPDLNKQPWTQTEEQLLFEGHRKYGNRWIQISKLFEGRTDNSIKNHFYSTIRRSMRRVCKILGNRNSTSKLRNIRPSVLSEIFQFSKKQSMKSNQCSENIDIASCLLQYARQKPRKSSQFDPSSRQDLQMLVFRLIQLNEQYVSFKKEKKNTKGESKVIKKQVKVMNLQTKKRQEWSETNSSVSQGDNPQKQHKANLSQSTIVEKQLSNQKMLSEIEEDDENFDSVSIGDELEIQSLNDYLIIKPAPVHSMFESTQDFNEKEHQLFHFLEKPSFNEMALLNLNNFSSDQQ